MLVATPARRYFREGEYIQTPTIIPRIDDEHAGRR
jgi:hypothetical protein